MNSRPFQLVFVTVLALLLVSTVAMPVAGHAYLSESEPANGEQRENVPEELSLLYSGDGVVIADVVVTGPGGDDVVERVDIDPDDPHHVQVSLHDDGAGMYIVEWEVLAEDGHTSTGTFFFSVGDEAIDRDAVITALADEEDESIPPVDTVAKGLLLLSLVGLIGIPLTLGLAVLPVARTVGLSTDAVDRRALPLLGACIGTVTLGLFLLAFARVGAIDPDRFGEFLSQTLGHIWLFQLLLTVGITAVVFLGWRKRLAHGIWIPLLIAGSTLIAAGIGWTSHSATLIGRMEGFAVTFSHIVGAGLWVGGLLTLAIVLPPILTEVSGQNRSRVAAQTIRRFSVLALAGVTLALTTGLVLAAWHVPSFDALVDSVYGLVLSVKTLAILFALGLGGLTRYVLLSDLEPWRDGLPRRLGMSHWSPISSSTSQSAAIDRVRRFIRTELVIVIVIILLAGLLTSVPTAGIVADADDPAELTFDRSDEEMGVHISIVPADEIGGWPQVAEDEPFVIDVTYTDADGPVTSEGPVRLLAEHSASGVTIDITLERVEETGMYSGVQVLPDPGHWDLRITGSPDGAFSSEWIEVFATPTGDDHDHGDEEPLTAGLSLALLVMAVLFGVVGVFATTIEAMRLYR